MSILQHGLTPKMKPLSPKRSALIAALDVGTSKVACLIARLKPNPRRDILRRRTHSIGAYSRLRAKLSRNRHTSRRWPSRLLFSYRWRWCSQLFLDRKPPKNSTTYRSW